MLLILTMTAVLSFNISRSPLHLALLHLVDKFQRPVSCLIYILYSFVCSLLSGGLIYFIDILSVLIYLLSHFTEILIIFVIYFPQNETYQKRKQPTLHAPNVRVSFAALHQFIAKVGN